MINNGKKAIFLLTIFTYISKDVMGFAPLPRFFQSQADSLKEHSSDLFESVDENAIDGYFAVGEISSRRQWASGVFSGVSSVALAGAVRPSPVWAGSEFTPGGTLVEYAVGPTVNNQAASPSRKFDNSNVLFYQDYFFKFGTAAPWIEPDSTEFPKSMPFTRIQQRYDALKKYRERILSGLKKIQDLESLAISADRSAIADPTATDVYQLRPMGLLANGMMASENTGSTNELFLARWYINEIYLLVNDLRRATSDNDAKSIVVAIQSATNSYLTMVNRVITSKVGDKFEYLPVSV